MFVFVIDLHQVKAAVGAVERLDCRDYAAPVADEGEHAGAASHQLLARCDRTRRLNVVKMAPDSNRFKYRETGHLRGWFAAAATMYGGPQDF